MKNLVFLGKVLHRLQLAGRLPSTTAGRVSEPRETVDTDHEHHAEAAASSDQETTLEEEERTEVKDLGWLINRLTRLAKYEAGRHPKESLKVPAPVRCCQTCAFDHVLQAMTRRAERR